MRRMTLAAPLLAMFVALAGIALGMTDVEPVMLFGIELVQPGAYGWAETEFFELADGFLEQVQIELLEILPIFVHCPLQLNRLVNQPLLRWCCLSDAESQIGNPISGWTSTKGTMSSKMARAGMLLSQVP